VKADMGSSDRCRPDRRCTARDHGDLVCLLPFREGPRVCQLPEPDGGIDWVFSSRKMCWDARNRQPVHPEPSYKHGERRESGIEVLRQCTDVSEKHGNR